MLSKVPKVGDVFYDVHSHRMGNTMISTVASFPVRVTEVAPDGCWFMASWNGNSPDRHYGVPLSWKRRKPYLVRDMCFGRTRKATREEKKTGVVTENSTYFLVAPAKGETNA